MEYIVKTNASFDEHRKQKIPVCLGNNPTPYVIINIKECNSDALTFTVESIYNKCKANVVLTDGELVVITYYSIEHHDSCDITSYGTGEVLAYLDYAL